MSDHGLSLWDFLWDFPTGSPRKDLGVQAPSRKGTTRQGRHAGEATGHAC